MWAHIHLYTSRSVGMRVEANETMKEWVSVGTIIPLQDPASI